MEPLNVIGGVGAGLIVAGASGFLGASLKSYLERHNEKKEAKTEGRAKAYEDFVVFCMGNEKRDADYSEIIARLVLYAETPVIVALEDFDPSKPDVEKLSKIIECMRDSLVTRHSEETMASITKILESDT